MRSRHEYATRAALAPTWGHGQSCWSIPGRSRAPRYGDPENAAVGGSANGTPLAPPPLPPERSLGTAALLNAFRPNGSRTWASSVPNGAASLKPKPDPVVASLERSIRSNPAFQQLTEGDKGVANWIIWRASMALPPDRLYYLNKLDTLFKTPSDPPRSSGAAALAEQVEADVDDSVARERARGNVFKGDEELKSATAVLSTLRGRGGTLYRIDARDPRAIVVKVKIHLRGEPTFVAKIKEFEDSTEKHASTRGYVLDIDFVNKGGADVFDVESKTTWPTSANLAGSIETIAHEVHHLLGLGDRYDYIEAHADNKAFPVNERLYFFAIQMQKPPDPRGFASLMNDQYRGKLLSEDVCAVAQGPQKECIDARKEFDPPGLPAHGSHPVH